jgi:hypothetical protein
MPAMIAVFAVVACQERSVKHKGEQAAPVAGVVPLDAQPDGVRRATPEQAEASSEDAADDAYEAKQWRLCGERWSAVAKTAVRGKKASALYDAARCYARAEDRDLAFEMLNAAIVTGPREVTRIETDEDLRSLHGDPRWTTVRRSARAHFLDWEQTLRLPRLRRELLARVDEDQRVRNEWLACERKTPRTNCAAFVEKARATDMRNTKALQAAIERYGWPGATLVGEDGAHAAWTIAQHADLEHGLQSDVLARMKPMIERGEVSASDYAYLYDRVAIVEHRKQLYGTQFNGDDPFPIEDEANVDARRRAVGLSSLAAYTERIRRR